MLACDAMRSRRRLKKFRGNALVSSSGSKSVLIKISDKMRRMLDQWYARIREPIWSRVTPAGHETNRTRSVNNRLQIYYNIYRKEVLGKRNLKRGFQITFELWRPVSDSPSFPLCIPFNSFAQQIG
jgi:hypothetical protein